ncbi:MAG: NrfD/PsrC family molybdoenzyme membrane anchor subunit [Planctomycetota bacterium]
MNDTGTVRLRAVKGTLWFILGVTFAVAIARFFGGLGQTTNLTDGTPWGLWVGFDVMGGVALAAGGFVIAALVYCFRLEQLRPLVRPAVLTAFLGYVAVAVGLMFDLGRPWNIWRPMFFWQHHSVLFEVAWCVMLYTTVLALEFLPVPLESSRFKRIYDILRRVTLPLVILGIMLSTLHQSSLGSLFLITPGRVHPLWYSPLLPLIFFVSAIGLGMAMVMVESRGTSWLYGKPSEFKLLKVLGKPLAWVLLTYAGIRFCDLVVRGHFSDMFHGWEAALFVFELSISALIPAALLLTGVAQRSSRAMTLTALMVVFGFILHRIDVGGVSGISVTGASYFPSWQEIIVTLGVVAGAIVVFLFFVENFNVYHHETDEELADILPPRLDVIRMPLSTVRHSSFLFVLGVALAFAFMPGGAVFGSRPVETPVRGARQVVAVEVPAQAPFGPRMALVPLGEKPAENWKDVLLIDGNRAERISLFDHDDHMKRLGGHEKCGTCHHLNKPNDRATSCWECHRDQYEPTRIFEHARHVKELGGNDACAMCHTDASKPRSREHTTSCLECHRDMIAGTDLVAAPAADSAFEAPGYMRAMHGACVTCHEREDAKNGEANPRLALCGTCHAQPVDLTPVPASGKE